MNKEELRTQFELQQQRVDTLRFLLIKTNLFFNKYSEHTQLFNKEFELYKKLKKDLFFLEIDKHSKNLLKFWQDIKQATNYDDFASFYDDFYNYFKRLFFSYGGDLFEDTKEEEYYYDLTQLMKNDKIFNEQLKSVCLKEYEKYFS